MAQRYLLALLAASAISAVPLNINLGAYSPALVVGDGEISFGGSAERASEVLQTLSAGAQNGAVPSGQTPPAPARAGAEAPAAQRPAGEGAVAAPAAPAGEASVIQPLPLTAAPAPASEGAPTSPLVSAADAGSVATAAVPGAGDAQLPAEFISHAVASQSFPNMKLKEKRFVVVPESESATEEVAEARKARKERREAARNAKVKRDIDGFRAALQYARDAALTAPRVELGFGIIQNAGANVAPNSAANGVLANGQPRPVEKREAAPEADAEAEPESDEKLGMTLIAISEI